MKKYLLPLLVICIALFSCSSSLDSKFGTQSSDSIVEQKIELLSDSIKSLNSDIQSANIILKQLESRVDGLESVNKGSSHFWIWLVLVISFLIAIAGTLLAVKLSGSNERRKDSIDHLRSKVDKLDEELNNISRIKSNRPVQDKPTIDQYNDLLSRIIQLERKTKEGVSDDFNQSKPQSSVGPKRVSNKGYLGNAIEGGLFKEISLTRDPDKSYFVVEYFENRGEFDIIDIKKLKSCDWFKKDVAITTGASLQDANRSRTDAKGVIVKDGDFWRVETPIKLTLFID